MAPTYGGAAAPSAPEALGYGERFSERARALFYARLAFLAIGLGVLAVPSWSQYLGATSSYAFAVYFGVIGYSVTNYVLLEHPTLGRPLTFATLNLDLVALTMAVIASGGLTSPMMAGQIVFTIFFALLFPRPLAIVPPLLMLPIVARFDATSGALLSESIFLLLWYGTLSFIAVYVLVYLNARDRARLEELRALSSERERALVVEERLRLSREMHDGLGGSLSTLIMKAEFIQRANKDATLTEEVKELMAQAHEAKEELQRSLKMTRRDFDLHATLEEHCGKFVEVNGIPCSFKVVGRKRRIPSEMQLAVFRILQECLTNIQKHAQAKKVDATFRYDGDLVSLTISDDGVGFDASKKRPGHYGLVSMGERVRKFRGTVDVQSALGAGTTVHVTMVIPIEGSHVALMPGEQGQHEKR
ncbi:MAG: sensor histidine kinase [Deltaproteobacteria bacterium]|nr:sensor histidine kinase [Deltaproteobacteria bacterium]